MSEQNAVTNQAANQGAMTVSTQQESRITLAARDFSRRLKYMIVNGNKLEEKEVFALAQFAAANDLNPFAGECYYMPGIGAIPGIAGWRKKANEQLIWEAENEGLHGAHFWIEWRECKPGEAVFDPNKDIAWHCTLHDYLTNKRWRSSIFETARELKGFGFEGKAAYEEAYRVVGEEPTWTAVGVVYSVENFSRDGKPEKFDRNERSKKRAEKAAIRKRFQRINLPDKGDYEDIEEADIRILQDDVKKIEGEMKSKSTDELMSNIGFAPEETGKKQQAIDVDIIEPEPESDEPHKPFWVDFQGLTVPDLKLENAAKEKNDKGVLYTDLKLETLQQMAREMATILMNGKTKSGPITDTARDNYQYKLSAIRAILMDLDSK